MQWLAARAIGIGIIFCKSRMAWGKDRDFWGDAKNRKNGDRDEG